MKHETRNLSQNDGVKGLCFLARAIIEFNKGNYKESLV